MGGACASIFFHSRFGDGFDDDINNISGGDEFEGASDWFAEFHAGVEFGDEFADEREVDRAGDDMDAVGSDVGGEFNFPDDDGVFGEGAAANFHGVWRGDFGGGACGELDAIGGGIGGAGDLDGTGDIGTGSAAGGRLFFENGGEFFEDIFGVGPFEGEENAIDISRSDIDFVDNFEEAADDGGIFGDEDRLGFGERGEVGVLALGLDDKSAEGLGKFRRVSVLEFCEEGNDLFAIGDGTFVGDDGDGGAPGIFADADDFDDVGAVDGDEGDAVEDQANFDNANGFIAGDFAIDGDGDGGGTSGLGIIDETFFGETFVEIEDGFEFGELEANQIVGWGAGDGRERRDGDGRGDGRG